MHYEQDSRTFYVSGDNAVFGAILPELSLLSSQQLVLNLNLHQVLRHVVSNAPFRLKPISQHPNYPNKAITYSEGVIQYLISKAINNFKFPVLFMSSCSGDTEPEIYVSPSFTGPTTPLSYPFLNLSRPSSQPDPFLVISYAVHRSKGRNGSNSVSSVASSRTLRSRSAADIDITKYTSEELYGLFQHAGFTVYNLHRSDHHK